MNKKIILLSIIAAIVLVSGGLYWYFSSKDSGRLSLSLPSIGKTSVEQLQGIWKPSKKFTFNIEKGEFQEEAMSTDERDTFLEFKNSTLCIIDGSNDRGEPLPCQSPMTQLSFTLEGNEFIFSMPDAPKWEYAIKNGELEITLESGRGNMEKIILIRFAP